jgi:REP element-mobilizing transposase RayT
MPRRPRNQIIVPGVPHHVVTRGNNRRRLFSYSTDYRRFVQYFEEAVLEHECTMQQVAAMPNHVHTILTPPAKDSLSDAMQSCLQRYARYRNEARSASGRLFEERFWCEPLMTFEAIEAVTLYCDSNAARAAIVLRPEDHVWSTCAIHYGQPERSKIPVRMWTPSDWYLSLGPDAPRVYAERMLAYLESRVPDWVHERLRAIETLASRDYRRRIERPDGTSAREPTEKRTYVQDTLDFDSLETSGLSPDGGRSGRRAWSRRRVRSRRGRA